MGLTFTQWSTYPRWCLKEARWWPLTSSKCGPIHHRESHVSLQRPRGTHTASPPHSLQVTCSMSCPQCWERRLVSLPHGPSCGQLCPSGSSALGLTLPTLNWERTFIPNYRQSCCPVMIHKLPWVRMLRPFQERAKPCRLVVVVVRL